MNKKIQVLILDSVFSQYDEEKKILKQIDADLVIRNPVSEKETIFLVSKTDAVIVNLHPIGKPVIDAMTRCKIISRYGVGYDNVDVESATARGIWVANVPDYCVEETADHTIALLLALTRRIALKDRLIREGIWKHKDAQPLNRMSRGVLGIIGYGRVGQMVHNKLSGFGFKKILVVDHHKSKSMVSGRGARLVGLEELLQEADYISLHVPLTEKTFHMIGAAELKMMKDGVILVNTSRGAVIDEKALVAALSRGKIGGAGLDVFETEPLPFSHPFGKYNDVILTDHSAYYSPESVRELKSRAAENVVLFFKEGAPRNAVNKIERQR
jgi:D-3-phosphoglycerate dehydrogenase